MKYGTAYNIGLALCLLLLFTISSSAQNDSSGNYFKFTLASQVWLRNTQMNPGTTINGYAKDRYTDIGIRRIRMQAFGQIADRVFIYAQVGMNNFNYLGDRKAGFFIHDITGEYEVSRKHLSLGGGLTAWNGLTRFAAPAVGSIMGIDAPLFEQTTNDVTDQFLRKLSIYAKGKISKFDYRLVLSSPLSLQKSAGYNNAVTANSTFSARPASMQMQGYFQWQFFDQEPNITPYTTGTYHGSRKVLNIGAGFQYQPNAMWHMRANSDTVTSAMKHFAADIYYDAPINKSAGTALNIYAAYINFDFGPGYIRNQATMNPANGSSMSSIINGSGNGYPSFGTGNLLYAQAGYKFKNNLVGRTTFMPYVSLQHAHYDRLADDMNFWDAGVNWLLRGHNSKLTLAWQSRPVYQSNDADTKALFIERKGSVILQYQVFLN